MSRRPPQIFELLLACVLMLSSPVSGQVYVPANTWVEFAYTNATNVFYYNYPGGANALYILPSSAQYMQIRTIEYGEIHTVTVYPTSAAWPASPFNIETVLKTIGLNVNSRGWGGIFYKNGDGLGSCCDWSYWVKSHQVYIASPTVAPSLISPVNSAAATRTMAVSYSLAEAPLSGSVRLVFDYGTEEYNLTLADSAAGSVQSFDLNLADLTSSSRVIAVDPPVNLLPTGTCNVRLQYINRINGGTAEDVASNVSIEPGTEPPTLDSPASDSAQPGSLIVEYSLPETPLSGSTRLIIDGGATPITLDLDDPSPGVTEILILDLNSDPSLLAEVVAVSPSVTSIPKGIYTVTLSYQDAAGNPAATATATNVELDGFTEVPTLNSPASSSGHGGTVAIEYSVPETALAGSTRLVFDDGSSTTTLVLAEPVPGGTVAFSLDLNVDPSLFAEVVSVTPAGATIPQGEYTVSLIYRDAVGNPEAAAVATSVALDPFTETPTLTLPASGAILGPTVPVEFSIPEPPAAGTVKLTFAGDLAVDLLLDVTSAGSVAFDLDLNDLAAAAEVVSSTLPAIPDGIYTVSVIYQAEFLPPAAAAFSTDVVVDMIDQDGLIPSLDPDDDNDTISDEDEINVWGTDPQSGNSALAALIAERDELVQRPTLQEVRDLRPGSILVEVVDGNANLSLQLQDSGDLSSWADRQQVLVPVPLESGEELRFFRFAIEPEAP